MMRLIRVSPNNEIYYSEDFVKGFNCGAKRQLEADKASIPKGHWILKHIETTPQFVEEWFYCSECGKRQIYGMPSYCPNCGADMGRTKDD